MAVKAMKTAYAESVITWGDDSHGLPHPLPGYCFAELDGEMDESVGGIVIPEASDYRNRMGFVGTVVVEHAVIHPRKHASIRGTVGRKLAFAQFGGERFFWKGRRLVKYPLRVSHLLAVYYEGAWIPLAHDGSHTTTMSAEPGVRRCRTCKSKGEGNILLDGDGFCPQCRKDEVGRPAPLATDRPKVTLSDDDLEQFGTPRERKPKGTIISYPDKIQTR